MPAIRLLQVLMWFVCAAHIGIGASLNLSPEAAPFLAQVYGAEVEWTPEFTYILKPLGAFMFALGLIGIAAARNPVKYGAIVYGFVVLFLIRCSQRFLFGEEILETFAIGSGRNLGNSIFFLVLALLLVVLHWKAKSAKPSS